MMSRDEARAICDRHAVRTYRNPVSGRTWFAYASRFRGLPPATTRAEALATYQRVRAAVKVLGLLDAPVDEPEPAPDAQLSFLAVA